MSGIKLKGMTWSHPRGHDPMVACSALWREKTGTQIEWDKRSLQDFESYPVEELARAYDLIVIDHPHVGQITRENCLAPLDVEGRLSEREALEAGSVGQSYPSYFYEGRQWAFPIDAATQVLAWRPDLIDAPPTRWDDVVALARQGRVLMPLRPPHSLMSLFTLSGNLGRPCRTDHGPLFDLEAGSQAFDMVAEIAALQPDAAFGWDPIAVFEEMARPDSTVAVAPLIYGYVSYAVTGFRPSLIRFADIAAAADHGVAGSALGGTGIAVSAFSQNRDAAIDFAYWVASGPVQAGPYAASGGQPGHATAWENAAVNAATHDFYRTTRATLEGAWVRPRHDGYMAFQDASAHRINEGIRRKEGGRAVIAELNAMYEKSLRAD